jgi:hypothetical protein
MAGMRFQFGSPARLNLPLRKEAALDPSQAAPKHDFRTTTPPVGINAGGVNEDRIRISALGIAAYVGKDAQVNVGKRTE